jgi:hypothetical protein
MKGILKGVAHLVASLVVALFVIPLFLVISLDTAGILDSIDWLPLDTGIALFIGYWAWQLASSIWRRRMQQPP